MRIGLTGDIHSMQDDGSDAPAGLFRALEGVDRIVACGDHISGGVLDRLADLAPVTATVNPNQPGDGGGRAGGDTTTFEAGGLRFGVMFSLVQAGLDVSEEGAIGWTDRPLSDSLTPLFDGPPDVLLFGGTHVPLVGGTRGLLLVNPGSPRFAARTTAAILDVDEAAGVVDARIVDV